MAKPKRKGGRVDPRQAEKIAARRRVGDYRAAVLAFLADPDAPGVEHNCRPPGCPAAHLTGEGACPQVPSYRCVCGKAWRATSHGGYALVGVANGATL